MIRTLVAILVVGVLASFAASTAIASPPARDAHDRSSESQWMKALRARSEALNEQYRSEPQWMKALRARSEGLNERYGPGGIATSPVPTDASQRSDAGRVPIVIATSPVPTDAFQRSDAGRAPIVIATSAVPTDAFQRSDAGRAPIVIAASPVDEGFAWDAAILGASSVLLFTFLIGGSLLTARHFRRGPLAH